MSFSDIPGFPFMIPRWLFYPAAPHTSVQNRKDGDRLLTFVVTWLPLSQLFGNTMEWPWMVQNSLSFSPRIEPAFMEHSAVWFLSRVLAVMVRNKGEVHPESQLRGSWLAPCLSPYLSLYNSLPIDMQLQLYLILHSPVNLGLFLDLVFCSDNVELCPQTAFF